jgi:hypothetical protein
MKSLDINNSPLSKEVWSYTIWNDLEIYNMNFTVVSNCHIPLFITVEHPEISQETFTVKSTN